MTVTPVSAAEDAEATLRSDKGIRKVAGEGWKRGTHAEEAAAGSEAVLVRTLSMRWTTPFLRRFVSVCELAGKEKAHLTVTSLRTT